MQTYLDNLLASMLEENKRLATCVTTMKSLVDEAKIDCQINNTENSDNMKHSTEQKPEAHRLAEKLRDAINMLECDFADDIDPNDLKLAAAELESLHTRVQELETKEAKPIVWPVAMPEPVAAQVRFKPENDTAWSSWKVCAVGYAREIEAYTLANGWGYEVRYLHAEQQVREVLATSGQSAETTEGATNEVTVLPDGSAFAVYSYPLPKDHWLYAPREYEHGAEEPKELAAPILTHEAREQVISAIRYAVRGATDCGKETDFDPDALVQNAVYALCGPFNRNQPPPQADALDAERYRWLRDKWFDNEPESINMERAKGQRGLDAAVDAAIALAKEQP